MELPLSVSRSGTVGSAGSEKGLELGTLVAGEESLDSSSSSSSAELSTARRFHGLRQRVVLMRHGERVDRIFPGWLRLAKDRRDGSYRPYDLNLPLALPARPAMADFHNDSPITEMGAATAQMLGRALRLSAIKISHVYVSPSLRCVQTAAHVMRYLGLKGGMRVEPGLFEWLGWYTAGLPTFMTPDQLRAAEFPLHDAYEPLLSVHALRSACPSETIPDYQLRTARVMDAILREAGVAEGVLIVAHAPTLDVAGRRLVRGQPPPPIPRHEMDKMGLLYPYTAALCLGKGPKDEGSWRVQAGVLPPISYLDFNNRISTAYFNRP